ncbi:PaaI family thioesterase [Planobispora takensis]|uniref:PaaI family thioesterase n=1 Tax=Planobispora takensis TaxID=1367882 RepID=UPI001940EF4B|nr:hotdog fold domain-containing protein [Planobispora takensis]
MNTRVQEFSVQDRYCGPKGMVNGGWISGLLAGYLPPSGAIEVTLRAPTPVGTGLRIERAGARAELFHGTELLVEAGPAQEDPLPPPFVSLDQARRAERHFVGAGSHPFPDCFVCGDREPENGMRIRPGAAGAPGTVAASWFAHPALAEWSASMPLTHVWGALDCPSGWAHLEPGGVALLGRLTARVHRQVVPGRTYVVVARRQGRERRKLFASSAVYETDGRLVAAAEATWIEM